jgi:hypothetical protein
MNVHRKEKVCASTVRSQDVSALDKGEPPPSIDDRILYSERL